MTAAARLAMLLPCSQCGQQLNARACGPTHAILGADPTRHRIVMDALAEALRDADPPTVARPRAVTLDPEDHDQVAKLNIRFHRGKSRSDVENMQAALREFLTDETREAAPSAHSAETAHVHEWEVEYLPDPMSGGSVVRSGDLSCSCGETTPDVLYPPAQSPSGGAS